MEVTASDSYSYGPRGVSLVHQWLKEKLSLLRPLLAKYKLASEDVVDGFLLLVLTCFSIALLVSRDSPSKIGAKSEEMLQLLEDTKQLGDAVNNMHTVVSFADH